MITSRITAEMAAPVPPEVAKALGLAPGDSVRFVIEAGGVRLLRAGQDEPAALDAWIERRLARRADAPEPLYPAEEVFERVIARLHRRSGPDDA